MFAALDLSALVYIAMRQIAVNGTFYMSAKQLAEIIWRVQPEACRGGKPPARETIYNIWSRLADRRLIKHCGYLPGSGVKRWELCDEAALECYERFSEAWHEVSRNDRREGWNDGERGNVVPIRRRAR
jgi:hypothetical protein